jgi:hypothetical protein
MFVPNKYQQVSMYDSFTDLPKYLQEYLLNSWADTFQEVIFPAINEERFAVLYSDKGSRPNTPVNIIISALIIKELFDLNDERLVANIHLSMEYQYALRLTSEQRPPVSKNTFTNFRKRVNKYYKETDIDLIQQEVEQLADLIAEKLEIKGDKARIDSFMVSSSCRELSRIELVYSVNAQFIKMLNQSFRELIPEELKVYLEKSHRNEVIYRTKNDETKSKLKNLLEDAKTLYDSAVTDGGSVTETEEFLLLKRMLGEQTDYDDNDFDNLDPDNIEAKDGKDLESDILQNPSDPDATYRKKYEGNIGYTANVLEVFDDNNSVIKIYDLKPNIYSDQKFSSDTLEKLKDDTTIVNDEENPFKLFMDGAYYTHELGKKALSSGIQYMPGELTGKKPAADKMTYYENFNLDSELGNILSCANDVEPEFQEKNQENQSFYAIFPKEKCAACDKQSECRIQNRKKHNSVSFTEKRYEIGRLRKTMGEKEYIKECNQRAGVEGIPSVFRRKYNVDDMPVMGLVCQKIWFGFKVAAANFKKLVKGLELATL